MPLAGTSPRTLSPFPTVVFTLGTSFVDALLCQAHVISMGGIQWRGQGGNCLYEPYLGKALPGPHLTLNLQLFREVVMMSFGDIVIWRMERYLRPYPGEEIRKGGGGACLCPATLPRGLYHKNYSNTWWVVGVSHEDTRDTPPDSPREDLEGLERWLSS